MMEETIINSKLFRKVESSDSFFQVSDLLQQIHEDLKSDRQKILELLDKAMSDSDDLKEAIKDFNSISSLPNVMIFGDIPNQYFKNLNDNAEAQIQLLTAIQKLQYNWIRRNERTGDGKGKGNTEDDEWNMTKMIDPAGKGSEFEDGILR